MPPRTLLSPHRSLTPAPRLLGATLLVATACQQPPVVVQPTPRPAPVVAVAPLPLQHAVIPAPAFIELALADSFAIDSTVTVVVAANASPGAEAAARWLSSLLAFPSLTTMPPFPPAPSPPRFRRLAASDTMPTRAIVVADSAIAAAGDEGYELTITRDRVRIAAPTAAGQFYGAQTLRQLLPASVEHRAALNRALRVPTGRVMDSPRFAWRGHMLDVSRHFLTVDEVKRQIDNMALYKLNRLHLHLADDQGWRIEIKSWPNLARHGGSTEVGGGAGGYYTQAQYADLVAYAADRHIVIVPEIDMPAHTNAALASYASLNCDRVAPPLYTGIRVGFSALCVDRDSTFKFVDDVVRELGALTPGPWFHIGGDEVEKLTHEQYKAFIERVQGIVTKHGKTMIGWSEVATASLLPGSIVQQWIPDSSATHAARGGKVIMSPAKRAYLDMKYDSTTVLGLRWAALLEVRDVYDWNPGAWMEKVPESAVLGVEGPLWSETVETLADFEFLAFPRLIALAEVGWSRQEARVFTNFSRRLGAHGPRLQALGVNFYRSPQVEWAR